MRILITHNNFPAQFRHIAEYLGRTPGNQVVFVTKTPRKEWTIEGVTKVIFTPNQSLREDSHPLCTNFENSIRHAQGMSQTCVALKERGFIPDVILGHSGWGQTLFMRDIFPDTPFICYFEWYYSSTSAETTFDMRKRTISERAQLRLRNDAILHDLVSCQSGITPTNWQRSQFPSEFHSKLVQVHDGIDTHYFSPHHTGLLSPQELNIPGLDLTGAKELITYCARGMEPYRGFPQFYQALPAILAQRPDCHVLIVGEDRVCYSPKLPEGDSYRKRMEAQIKVDESRVHFTGPLPYGQYKQVLLASSAHIYLTWPFVLSWSLLEAMSCGCLIIGSDTDPVHEVLRHGENGLMTDFHSPAHIADTTLFALEKQAELRDLRTNARQTILDTYCLSKCLPIHLKILAEAARSGPRYHKHTTIQSDS
ncbi:glycosyltransferase [Pseudodesulfovibrio piezophilus]|uniref:Glycosyl transferase group 1 n=1 Tax=Pseudodesulfovibrio piezophilus (strain DSM 21447 / JCM 15486 / C1TLV30) TaxID=1322246 RepID=M1WJN3_PSEP2|nr:glycosyltransferase [Pseudodesulfovibrio piezophilus]CCH48196.1 Glycosyl transferase group 1 [Pseudodesulfovibrio piezophilus C1TLV30]